jgi:hypothetical protein
MKLDIQFSSLRVICIRRRQVFLQKIHEVETTKDYIEEARIINHMLFYKKDLSGHENKYEILLLK